MSGVEHNVYKLGDYCKFLWERTLLWENIDLQMNQRNT